MRILLTVVAVVGSIFFVSCSDKKSSAMIDFNQAFVGKGILDEKASPNLLSADNEVVAVLKGQTVNPDPKKRYLLPYESPTFYVTIQCLGSAKLAIEEYKASFEQPTYNNPLKLEEHPDLPLGVPAVGFWGNDPSMPKGVLFRYGNVIVGLADPSADKSPAWIQEVAKKYVAYLDGVAK